MLRITPTEKSNSLGLRLEGRLEGPWVEVLRKTWAESLNRDGHRQQVVVDLGGLSFADSDGRALLRNMHDEGVGLIKASAFLREILKSNGWILNQQDSNRKGE